ncbi:MAG: NUDIX domain-containing protein [Oscillospiraceae bacterium]|nr:NUDIX domain-containing protein [Oscillospiraceae bacterium]
MNNMYDKEFLDVCDEKGEPTGETVSRADAHRKGIRHRTAHLWIVCGTELLLQKRSPHKDSFPDCYDTSSAGHIPAGCGFAESALRELYEELGVTADKNDLETAGYINSFSDRIFHSEPFINNEYSIVYILRIPPDKKQTFTDSLSLQESEIASVKWQEYKTVLSHAENGDKRYCINKKELYLLGNMIGGKIKNG